MRILLLGGTGTLSSDIMKLSLEKGYDVSILNRGNNNERVDNRVSIHKANLYNIETVIQTLEGKSYEVIIDFFQELLKILNDYILCYLINVYNIFLYHQLVFIVETVRIKLS